MQRSTPYPSREDARACIAENPASFLDERASNDLTRHALIRGIHSLQRLAWWHRVAVEEGYPTDEIVARRDALLATGDSTVASEPSDEEPSSAEQSRIDAVVAKVEQAETVDELDAIQREEVQRDEPEKKVIAAINERRAELEAIEAGESEQEAEEDLSENVRACAACGVEHAFADYSAADECPSCETALTVLLDQWQQPTADADEVTA